MVNMDKNDFKKVIKPILKECIKEILLEQGLTKLVSETAASINENKIKLPAANKSIQTQPIQKAKQSPINQNHKLMMEEIGKSGYLSNNFNPFANTNPLTEAQAGAAVASANSPLANIDPNDSGVDITDFMSGNTNVWKALVGGKGK